MALKSPEESDAQKALRAFGRDHSSASFLVFVERYLSCVWGAAKRQLGDELLTAQAVRAVFIGAAQRPHAVARNRSQLLWLHRATGVAARRLKRTVNGSSTLNRPTILGASTEPENWQKIEPLLDALIDSLAFRQREAILKRFFFSLQPPPLPGVASSKDGSERHFRKGMAKVCRRLRKRGIRVTADELARVVGTHNVVAPPSQGYAAQTAEEAICSNKQAEGFKLAERVLAGMAWLRWKRRLKIGGAVAGVGFVLLASVLLYVASLWQSGELMARIIEWSATLQAREIPKESRNARPWPAAGTQPLLSALSIQDTTDFYRITNVWVAHLTFAPDQWDALAPKRIPPVPNIIQKDGKVILRNPKAKRSGLAGALGYEFDWVRSDLDLGGVTRRNVAVRFKGNGTYIGSLYSSKRPFKVKMSQFTKNQSIAGIDELNFSNLIEDRSYMSDALGYELFRSAGVPAPRTAYAWLSVTVPDTWDDKPFGLYVLVEPVDSTFAAKKFGTEKAPIFKPVTYDLFQYLGEDYSSYREIYDLKTKASPAQKKRLVEFARFVTEADDSEFALRVGEYLDLDGFARFLGVLVLLSSYDGFLTNGQNSYLYLDPRSNKFGFIPWDLDHAWGGFPLIGTAEGRERASIFHPWAGKNRFLERMMAVEEFKGIYRMRLEELLATVFSPAQLFPRIDEVAAAIRSPISAESAFRLEQFDRAVSAQWSDGPRDGEGMGPRRPVHQLKRFITNRAASVREQLDGKSEGVVLSGFQPNRR